MDERSNHYRIVLEELANLCGGQIQWTERRQEAVIWAITRICGAMPSPIKSQTDRRRVVTGVMTLQDMVMQAVNSGCQTTSEVAEETGISINICSAYLCKLLKQGKVRSAKGWRTHVWTPKEAQNGC